MRGELKRSFLRCEQRAHKLDTGERRSLNVIEFIREELCMLDFLLRGELCAV